MELREEAGERGVESAFSTEFASGPFDFEAVELSLLISGESDAAVLSVLGSGESGAFEGAAMG